MEKNEAVAALAQEHRLEVYRLAGGTCRQGGRPGRGLTFHLDRLRHAGLVSVSRQGRSLIYAARYETMNNLLSYLTDNCCGGQPELCSPKRSFKPKKETVR
jgi:ArsR family transcriptional regulator